MAYDEKGEETGSRIELAYNPPTLQLIQISNYNIYIQSHKIQVVIQGF